MKPNTDSKPQRPLSPHIGIYKWQITMMVSILHRATGLALVAGTVLLVGWLWAAAYSADCFIHINHLLNTIVGRLLLFGWSLAFYLHFCNGIRHLFWDTGRGFEKHTADKTAWAVLLFGSVLTLITWYAVLVLR